MLKFKQKIFSIQCVIGFLFVLFVFVLMMDPAGTVLPLKNPLFIALIGLTALTYHKLDKRFLAAMLFLYSAITLSLFRGWFCGYSFNYDFTIYIFKTFSPLLIIIWAKNFRFFTWKSMVTPGILISFITILIIFLVMQFPALEEIVYNFMQSRGLMLMARRSILGIQITVAYYRSLPVLVFPAAILVYKCLNEKNYRFWTFLGAAILCIPLFVGGTRATFLSTAVIIFLIIAQKMNKTNIGKMSLAFVALCFIPLFFLILYKLMAETAEPSNAVKYGHLVSYIDLVKDDPSILLFGSGPGSRYFSKGFNIYTEQTEWSYLEFFRMFGGFTMIFLLILYFYPLYKAYKRLNELKYAYPFMVAFFIYLMIGGTNPLLIGSNGTLALIYGYNFVWRGETIENNKDEQDTSNNSDIQ